MLPFRQSLFHGMSCLFQQDNSKLYNSSIWTVWLHSRRVWVMKESACSPNLSPTENIWSINKTKSTTKQTQDAGQLESSIWQKWENIPLPFSAFLSSIVNKICLRFVNQCILLLFKFYPASHLFFVSGIVFSLDISLQSKQISSEYELRHIFLDPRWSAKEWVGVSTAD